MPNYDDFTYILLGLRAVSSQFFLGRPAMFPAFLLILGGIVEGNDTKLAVCDAAHDVRRTVI